jgi:hypothetical protein
MIKILLFAKAVGTLCLMLCFYGAGAQSKPDTTTDDKPVFKVGLSFINNDIFYGRADTVATPTIIPLIKYTFGSGLYLSADLNIVTNRKNNKVDGGSIAAGYEFALSDDLEGSTSFTKWFYNGNSTQVGSANRGNFNANLNYNLADIITPSISFDYNFNRSGVANDTYINAGLSHDFEFDNFTISPSVELNIGTQNFYNDYVARRVTRNKKATVLQNPLTTAEQADLARFQVLDYEFSVPFEYENNHVIVNFTPTYTLAQNKLPANISSGLSVKSNIFYFQLGVVLKF